MADKVSGYGRPGLDISSARSRAVANGKGPEDTQARNRAQAGQDAVDFSDTVANLRRIEAQLKSLPEIDESRVAEVRARLESGSYEINAERVASKLARLEQDLS